MSKRRRFRVQQLIRFSPANWVMIFSYISIGTCLSVLLIGIPHSMSAPAASAVPAIPEDAATAILETELPKRSAGEQSPWAEALLEQFLPMRFDDPRTWVEATLPSPGRAAKAMKETALVIDDTSSTEAPPPKLLVKAAKAEDAIVPAAHIPSGLGTGGKKVVFIYHTHNREAYLPDLKGKSGGQAYDEKTNITLVGKRLAEELKKRGIGAEVSTEDYWPLLSGRYHLSYAFSRKTVEAAVSSNRDLQYVLDIHRDALPREKTTRTINGDDYAAIVFVVGKANKNWEQNQQFAMQLHEALEQLYPGLSKGVTGKNTEGGRSNGEYNQSVHPNSILVEIGGHENTLEEAYRSAAALADALAAVYWQAEAVDAPADDSQ